MQNFLYFKVFIILFSFVNYIFCRTQCTDAEYAACDKLYNQYMIECNQYGYGATCSNIITADCTDEEKVACNNFQKEYPNVGTCSFSNLAKNCYT